MINYISKLEDLLSHAISESAKSAPFPNEIVLYGAGSIGRECILLLQSKGVLVRAVIDAKSALRQLEGVPVLHPEDLSFSAEEKAVIPVVISIFNHQISMLDVQAVIESAGWGNVTGFLQFHRQYAADIGDRYWLTAPSFYNLQRQGWREGSELWHDDESSRLYCDILKFRFTADYQDAPLPHPGVQYFPGDIPSWRKNLRFVDCGAFDGDTLEILTRQDLQIDAIAAFEPDGANLEILSKKLKAIGASARPAALWPCGVHSSTTQLRFSSGQGAGSAISASGDTVVQCVSLDDVLVGFQPNLIKMDIEGAEYGALLGARKLIETHRPGLAICVYHHPAHLWEIPALVKSWNLDYSFFLRVHYYNGFDLVMYAVPS